MSQSTDNVMDTLMDTEQWQQEEMALKQYSSLEQMMLSYVWSCKM